MASLARYKASLATIVARKCCNLLRLATTQLPREFPRIPPPEYWERPIEKGEPWQNYSEMTLSIQRRMADWHFARAESWAELVREHERWWTSYNAQRHSAHEQRKDGRRSPEEVLSWVTGMRFHPKDLERAFFSTRFSRKLDSFGYATLQRFRLYAEEALARKEAALWLQEETLSVEYGGQTLSSYEVKYDADSGNASGGFVGGKLREVMKPTLFETSYAVQRHLRLFELATVLGEEGWLKVLGLDDYAPRRPRRPDELQQAGPVSLHGGYLGTIRRARVLVPAREAVAQRDESGAQLFFLLLLY